MAGTASIHLNVFPQRPEHSWDGYARYTKVPISFHFHDFNIDHSEIGK
jgi:hypothetical protein